MVSKVDRVPFWHSRSDFADAGLPDVETPYHSRDEGVVDVGNADRVTTHTEGETRHVGPESELTGDTVIADLPKEAGNFRPPIMQSSYFARRLDQLGEVPYTGLHGRVIPLAEPSTTQGDPDFYDLGYLIREIPSSSSDDLGLVV